MQGVNWHHAPQLAQFELADGNSVMLRSGSLERARVAFAPAAAAAGRNTRAHVYDAERRFRAKKPHALISVFAVATIAVGCNAAKARSCAIMKDVAQVRRVVEKLASVNVLNVPQA
eukprot:1931790-Pleurochrysis_carterae.AAC.1